MTYAVTLPFSVYPVLATSLKSPVGMAMPARASNANGVRCGSCACAGAASTAAAATASIPALSLCIVPPRVVPIEPRIGGAGDARTTAPVLHVDARSSSIPALRNWRAAASSDAPAPHDEGAIAGSMRRFLGMTSDVGDRFRSPRPSRLQRQQGERREPVLAHVVAGDVSEAGGEVRGGGGFGAGAARVALGPGARKRAPAPGAAQVHAVQVGDLAVGAVAHRRGAEERRRLLAGDAREEALHPRRELVCR